MVSKDLEEPCGAEPWPVISMESRESQGCSSSVCTLQQNVLLSRESQAPLDLQRAQRLGWLSLGSQGPGEGSSEQSRGRRMVKER